MVSRATEPPFDLKWRGMLVGQLLNPARDMWYLEGKWAPADTPHAVAFGNLVASLVAKAVMADPRKGTRVESCGGDPSVTNARTLSLRRAPLPALRVRCRGSRDVEARCHVTARFTHTHSFARRACRESGPAHDDREDESAYAWGAPLNARSMGP